MLTLLIAILLMNSGKGREVHEDALRAQEGMKAKGGFPSLRFLFFAALRG